MANKLKGHFAYGDLSEPITTTRGGKTSEPYRESFAVGSLRASVRSGKPIALMIDHRDIDTIATTAAGNLIVTEDDNGVGFILNATDERSRDVCERAQHGDFTGLSFSFSYFEPDVQWAADKSFRTVNRATLTEFSLMTRGREPAYRSARLWTRDPLRQFARYDRWGADGYDYIGGLERQLAETLRYRSADPAGCEHRARELYRQLKWAGVCHVPQELRSEYQDALDELMPRQLIPAY